MPTTETTEDARQADGNKDNFRVLMISCAIAAVIAIAAAIYVFVTPTEEVPEGVPAAGLIETDGMSYARTING